MIKRFTRIVIVLGVILGGIAIAYSFLPKTVTYKQAEPVQQEVPKEPTEEEKRFAELMKIKEQEAKLELKRDLQKEELESKNREYNDLIAKIKSEHDNYVTTKENEIKSTEAELASFIKATSLSKKE